MLLLGILVSSISIVNFQLSRLSAMKHHSIIVIRVVFSTGKFKEWTLTLHGTWEHPYQSHEGQSSQSRTPEVPSPGLVPGDPAQALSGPEDLQEDEYNGKPVPACTNK